jgi:two-component system OmpR family response regulator
MTPEDPHILVVDDHREIRESLAQFLRKNGRRATAVESAEAARRAIKENRIDAVILDIMMPGEDGLSLCRHIRETNHIPVILLSARAEELDRIIGLEVGADDYVVKPFNPRELLARIDAVLRRTHALPPNVEAPTGEALRFDRWTLKLAERELVDDEGQVHEMSTGEYRLLLTFLQRPQDRAVARSIARSRLRWRQGRVRSRGRYASQPPAPQDRSRRAHAETDQNRLGRRLRLHGAGRKSVKFNPFQHADRAHGGSSPSSP